MKLLTSLILLVALCQSVFADQPTIDIVKVKAVTGAQESQVFKNVVLINDNAELKVVPAAVIKVTTDAAYVQVKARASLFELGTLIEAKDNQWLLLGTTPGKYAVEVTTFDPDKGIGGAATVVELGPVTPVPPTPPGPVPPGPVPPNPNPDCNNVLQDAFKDLGRRTCGWATGLPMRREMAGIYAQAANMLRTDPAVTPNTVGQYIVDTRQQLLGTNLTAYKTLVDNANNELKTYWPMNKATLADFFTAISLGLANGQ